jgi:hypothetical protein
MCAPSKYGVNTQCGHKARRGEGLKGMLGVNDRRKKKGNALLCLTKCFQTQMYGF